MSKKRSHRKAPWSVKTDNIDKQRAPFSEKVLIEAAGAAQPPMVLQTALHRAEQAYKEARLATRVAHSELHRCTVQERRAHLALLEAMEQV